MFLNALFSNQKPLHCSDIHEHHYLYCMSAWALITMKTHNQLLKLYFLYLAGDSVVIFNVYLCALLGVSGGKMANRPAQLYNDSLTEPMTAHCAHSIYLIRSVSVCWLSGKNLVIFYSSESTHMLLFETFYFGFSSIHRSAAAILSFGKAARACALPISCYTNVASHSECHQEWFN